MTRPNHIPSRATSFSDMVQALAQDPQPERGLRTLAATLAERIGWRLCTVLILDHSQGLSWRCFSSHPEIYPTGGTKPIRKDSDFFAAVVESGQPRICADRAACENAFPDYALIRSLQCESAVNMPVRWNGQTIASLNLLHEAGWYRQDMLAELRCHAAFCIPLVQHIIHATHTTHIARRAKEEP